LIFSWTCQRCGKTFKKDTKQKLAVARSSHERRADKLGPPSRLENGKSNPAYFIWWYAVNKRRKLAYEKRDYLRHEKKWRQRAKQYYYQHREQIARANHEYHNTPRGRSVYRKASIKTQARRRGIPIWFTLGRPFPGAHLHHIEEHVGIYIPKPVHDSIRHNLKTKKGMIEINEAVADWLDKAQERLAN
jgi:hypothetical protein